MRSSRHIVRRLVLPLLTLALVVVPSYSWLRAGHVPGRYVNRCQAAVFETDAPPADLLLIGASRTGFGFDTDLVDLRLSTAQRRHRTEKIVLLGNAESDTNMALRTYLRERGTPRSLGIEVLVTRTATGSAPARSGAALTGRSTALFGADAYSDLLDGLVREDVVGRHDIYGRSYFPSPLNFFFQHLQIGFDNAWRNPGEMLDPLDGCERTVLPVWGPVASAPYTDATPRPSTARIEKMKKDAGRYVKVNLDSRVVAGEAAVMRDVLRVAKSAGVKNVFLYYFPSFGETADILDLEKLTTMVPGVGLFDARPVLADPTKPGLDLQFQDRAHLTKWAAHEVSVAFTDYLKGFSG